MHHLRIMHKSATELPMARVKCSGMWVNKVVRLSVSIERRLNLLSVSLVFVDMTGPMKKILWAMLSLCCVAGLTYNTYKQGQFCVKYTVAYIVYYYVLVIELLIRGVPCLHDGLMESPVGTTYELRSYTSYYWSSCGRRDRIRAVHCRPQT